MDNPEESVSPLIASARRAFSFFYEEADEDDVQALDLLVLTSRGVILNIEFPREPLPPSLRASIERLGNLTELTFMDARRLVSESRTFQNLDCNRQQQIVDALFSPFRA